MGYLMVYGAQQWPTLLRMDADELNAAYHCVGLIKKAEADATKQAIEDAKNKR
jgi:hypothetical protein